jgi:hypothetical protein
VTAGGLADRHDAGEVERRVEALQRVDRGADVLERRGIAALAHLADAAVLDVPRRPAVAGEVAREVLGRLERVLLAPEAGMEHDRDRQRAVHARRQQQVGELVEVRPVTVTHGHVSVRAPNRSSHPTTSAHAPLVTSRWTK